MPPAAQWEFCGRDLFRRQCASEVERAGLAAAGLLGERCASPSMKIAIYLLLAVLLFGVFRTHRSVRRSTSAEERAIAIRVSAFAWLVGLLLLLAFVFLPNRQRVILMVPTFVGAVGLAKFWRDKRAQLRRAAEEQTRLDRMKRVHGPPE